jgi:hypothetical protein
MAQTGYTPILIYGSGTTGNTPSAGNLTSSSAGAELAINYFDGKLFYKDNAGVVQTLATKGTGSIGGSTTEVQYNNAGALAGSANLTFNGTTLTANALTVSSGNLTFSSTAQRITGDFSNATVANRLAFQTSTVNGNTSVAAIPNGTSVQANIRAFANSDPTNASFTDIGADPTVGSFLRAERAGTGTYLPMTFYTGGSERVRVDTSGNVGIGTASPSGNLQVSAANTRVRFSNTAGTASALLFGADSGSVFLGAETNAPLYFITNNTERMRIDASGNVGIGTASPSVRLHAVAADGVTNTRLAGASYALRVQSIAATGTVVDATNNTESTYQPLLIGGSQVQFTIAGSERMRIDASGNVGIGTSSPGDRLDVVGGNIRIASGNTVRWVDAGNIRVSIQGDSSSNAIFSTAATERMRIDSSGNIVAGASAALATNATNGFLYVPTCAGTPTGVPTAITGMAPIVVDTTNNKLYFYSNAAWRDAGP